MRAPTCRREYRVGCPLCSYTGVSPPASAVRAARNLSSGLISDWDRKEEKYKEDELDMEEQDKDEEWDEEKGRDKEERDKEERN